MSMTPPSGGKPRSVNLYNNTHLRIVILNDTLVVYFPYFVNVSWEFQK